MIGLLPTWSRPICAIVSSHLDEDPILTVMDAITDQTANTAGVNLHTSPLHTTQQRDCTARITVHTQNMKIEAAKTSYSLCVKVSAQTSSLHY